MSALYHYLFASDCLIITYNGLSLCIRPGDPCHVKSERLGQWCLDGVVKSCYKGGVYVAYGHSHYFGMFTRGNEKYVPLEKITELLRFPNPHALKPIDKKDLKTADDASCLP